jgi:hypothetical protein
VARLVWLVDASGTLGVWTTDLAGGDARTYLAGLDEIGVALRDATLAGEDVVLIRDGPTSDLWLLPGTGTPRVLLDRVGAYRVTGPHEMLALREAGTTRELWRVRLDGPPPERIGELPSGGVGGGELGAFSLAVSPDGRSVAAGWVGGPVAILGPHPAELVDVGAPLVVDDTGELVAVTGRAGEAYTLRDGALKELAPADADPLAAPRSGVVAWGVVDGRGDLEAVEVRDLLDRTDRTYPAAGAATNVREVTGDHVVLEATAFDPLRRTAAFLDLRDGSFAVFEAEAPEPDRP